MKLSNRKKVDLTKTVLMELKHVRFYSKSIYFVWWIEFCNDLENANIWCYFFLL